MEFICYPKCSTCEKAKKWLDSKKLKYTERNISEKKPTYEELKKWHEKSGVAIKDFFDTSSSLFEEKKLKDKIATMSDDEMLKCLATDGMLLKRPILVNGDKVLIGFNESEWEKTLTM